MTGEMALVSPAEPQQHPPPSNLPCNSSRNIGELIVRLRKIILSVLATGAVLTPTAALADTGSNNGGNNNDGDGIVNVDTDDVESDDDADDVDDTGGSGNGGNNNDGDGAVNS